MSAVCKCDLCGMVDTTAKPDDEYCRGCVTKLLQIKADQYGLAHAEIEQKFQTAIAKQVAVIGLLKWLRYEKHQRFQECFGTQGMTLLDAALPTGSEIEQ